jgi:serine/threonine protein kinase
MQPDDYADRKNIIGVNCETLNQIVKTVEDISDWTAGHHKSINTALFDEIDRVVFHYLKTKHFTAFKESPYWISYHEFMIQSERPINEDDFSLFRILGRGGFGMVNGCKKSQTGKLYAMKTMNKKRVKMKKAEALCLNERNILTFIDSPFVVCMKYSFVSNQELFLILDLMTGGDLGYHLSRRGKFNVVESKYYAARIILGIKALHEQSIVYRYIGFFYASIRCITIVNISLCAGISNQRTY